MARGAVRSFVAAVLVVPSFLGAGGTRAPVVRGAEELAGGSACVLRVHGAPGRTARQERRERERQARLAISRYKRGLREARLQARRAENQAAREDGPAPSTLMAVGSAAFRPSPAGMVCLALVTVASLSDPMVHSALAQMLPGAPPFPATDPLASLDRGIAKATVWLDGLGPPCRAALLAGEAPPPCAPAYGTGLLAKAADLRSRMAALFVPASTLGAGSCRAGESSAQAKGRVALDQSDILARFELLGADASALQYEVARDGYLLEAVGTGILTGRAGLGAAAVNGSAPVAVASFALGEVGTGIVAGGFAVEAVANLFGRVAGLAEAYRDLYQRWANNQTELVLGRCGSTPAPTQAPAATGGLAPETGLPAATLGDAILKLSAGCELAQRSGAQPLVCTTATFDDLRAQNGTLSDLWLVGTACLAAGTTQGRQGPCPRAPVADSRTRTDTFALLGQFGGEINVAAYDVFFAGDAFEAASEGFVIGANAAAFGRDPLLATGLLTAATGVAAIADALFAQGYELFRLGAVARAWVAQLTLEFNAESRADLDRREAAQASPTGLAGALAGSPSSTAPALAGTATAGTPVPAVPDAAILEAPGGPVEATGDPGPGTAAAAPEPEAATTGPDADPHRADAAINAALRARPWVPWLLVRGD